MKRFRLLALATAVATLLLVSEGGLVRATGSGLGCLDAWPSCRGGWRVPADWQGVVEYAHRALAAVVIGLVVALAVAAWRLGVEASLRRWSVGAVVPFLLQAGLGALAVRTELHAAVVTAHLLAAMLLVGATVRVAAGAWVAGRPPASGEERRLAGMAVGAAAGTLLVLAAGAYVREKGAGLAFPDWPLMDGRVVPELGGTAPAAQFVHRLLAALVFGHVLATATRARRDPRPGARGWAFVTAGAFGAQVVAGAATVWSRLAPGAVLAHVALGAVTWASAVALVVVCRRAGPAAGGGRRGRLRDRLAAYVQLTKPRIVLLLLVTTVPSMVLAARGLPSWWLVTATLVGGSLAAGGANAINQYLERDIDRLMRRTRGRPLPSSRIEPNRALGFGVALGAVAFGWLALTVNLLSAALAAGALLFYVLVYTVWLKRTTVQNIVVGGAAGAVPCLVGWAAVRGRLELPAWILFAIVFLWTPPHFWALAMNYEDDYAKAGVPMLPVVRGAARTAWQILLYSLVLVAATVLLYPAAGMGPLYLGAALGLGALFVWRAARLVRRPTGPLAYGLFRYSIGYLALLFAAVGTDRLLWR